MKPQNHRPLSRSVKTFCGVLALCALASANTTSRASIAYGTINNFDTVNDTGTVCHGFEIEIDDSDSKNITYCFSYNHYGTPKIIEDRTSVPGHTNTLVRYESAKNTNGTWAAYTAIPTTNLPPTQGHQYTNPSLNFGGEHFGVGYRGTNSGIKYNWLKDNGAGVLVKAGAVNVSTPTFVYSPPVGAAPAQVQAVIAPPPPPAPPIYEFGNPSWVKEIRTTSHTNSEIRLRDLVSPDADFPEIKDWRNGEPDQVEIEWQLLQVDYLSAGGGPNAELAAAPENLGHSDDIVTRRYEFYKYTGPLDPETNEALEPNVGADGLHGVTYSNTVVVGKFLGAQMSAFDAELNVGLVDHVPDGKINTAYGTRAVIIAGVPFTATNSGALPAGMTFNNVTGELSGTPTASGVFTFNVRVTPTNAPVITKSYSFAIAAAGVNLPPHCTVDTASSPVDRGTTTGTGLYTNGTTATVTATPVVGFKFAQWIDNGATVSSVATYQFTNTINRSLVAVFVALPPTLAVTQPSANTLVLSWPTNATGYLLQESLTTAGGGWLTSAVPVTIVGTNNQATISPMTGDKYFRLRHP